MDEDLDALISRIKLYEGDTEFWKRRFLGEVVTNNHEKQMDTGKPEPPEILDDVEAVEDAAKEVEDDEADDDDEEEGAEQPEEAEPADNQDVDRVKDNEVEAKKPLQMIGVQLLKDSDQPNSTSKKSKKVSKLPVEV